MPIKTSQKVKCANCGELVSASNTEKTPDNKLYCLPCFREYCFICAACENAFFRDAANTVENDRYCNACFDEDFFYCHDCGEVYDLNDVYRMNGDCFCQDCYESRSSNITIHDSGYKPDPIFHKKKWENTCFMGIELEVEPPQDEIEECAEDLIEEFQKDDFFYLKEDASITGFEIVSHPHTLELHKERNWYKILNYMKRHSYRSYDGGNCGLHVHISRKALSNLNWHKIELFFFKCRPYLETFAKRKVENLEQWAKIKNPSHVDAIAYNKTTALEAKTKPEPMVDILNLSRPKSYTRYEAVNFQNRTTVEIRLFRGTLYYDRFWASLSFCDALVYFIQIVGFNFLRHKKDIDIFHEFMLFIKTDYHHLYVYLKKEVYQCAS